MTEQQPRTREIIELELAQKAFQDEAFLEKLRQDPKGTVAAEYGVNLSDKVQIKLIEETPDTLYVRLPPNPNDLELTDEQLEQVSGGATPAIALTISYFASMGFSGYVGYTEATDSKDDDIW